MKTLSSLFVGICALFAGIQWWQLGYRLDLFYREYHRERFANHVGDDVFAFIHVVNVLLLLMGGFSSWTFRRETALWRWSAVGITVANLVAWLAFVYMRATGMLVGYMEFIEHWKGR